MLRSGGLISGIDTNTLVQQLVQIEKLPIGKLQQKKAGKQNQISLIGQIKSALSDLQAKAKKVDTAKELLTMTGSSTNETAFSASATGNAAPASYSLTVDQMATAEKDRSAAFASATAQVEQGSLDIAVKGGAVQTVTIAPGDTLQDVAAKINDSVDGATASIISDGTSSYLSITADESGHTIGGSGSDSLVITESYGGGGGSQLNLTEIQTAANALLTLDGLTVESESNDVTTAITGLTIHAEKLTTSTETLTIEPDKTAIEATVQDFVDAYNTAMELVIKQTTITAETDRASTLAGDASIRGLRQVLSSAVGSPVASLSGTKYNALATLGITTDPTGKLKLDTDDFQNALDANLNNVQKVFTAVDGIMSRMQTDLDPYTDIDGILKARTDGLTASIKDIDSRIAALELRVESFELSLVRQFTALELTVSSIQDQGNYLASVLG